MKTSEIVKDKLSKLPKGYIFTYKDFLTDVSQKEAIIKYLNRLAKANKITKQGKGKFYKPEASIFGDLQPKQNQIVKDILEKNGKIQGYMTGLSVYNELGFTTQISNTIQIGKNSTRPTLQRGIYKICFIKQANTITKQNIYFLQLLDVLRFIKKIPDSNINQSILRLQTLLAQLSNEETKSLIRLSLKYPPSTRSLLGAILESNKNQLGLNELFESLNPVTIYRYPGLSTALLPTVQKWNIKVLLCSS